jgi:hypothetical protein
MVLGVMIVVVLFSIPIVGIVLGILMAMFGLGAVTLDWPRRRESAPARPRRCVTVAYILVMADVGVISDADNDIAGGWRPRQSPDLMTSSPRPTRPSLDEARYRDPPGPSVWRESVQP